MSLPLLRLSPAGWLSCPPHPKRSLLAQQLLLTGLQLGWSGLLLLQHPMHPWLLVAWSPVCCRQLLLLLLLLGRRRQVLVQQQTQF